MCVAIPGRVVAVGQSTPSSIPARVSSGGIERDVDLILVPEAAAGDYVVVHSGYAIEIVPESRALETIELIEWGL